MPRPIRMLKLEHEATFFGPNPFATDPVIVVRIGPSDGDSLSSDEALSQGCRLLRESFPEWVDTPAAWLQHPMTQVGGTAARWALAALNETDGFLHDAGAVPVSGGARVWLGFHHPDVTISALKTALAILAEATRLRQIDRSRVDSALEALWRLCRNHHPDYDSRVLMQGARALDIPVLRFIGGRAFWQYGWGSRSRVFMRASSNADGYLGGAVAHSKVLSKMVFAELGMPTPEHRLVTQAGELAEAIKAVGCPCVVKPISMGGGKGVTAGIKTLSEAEAAFAVARHFSGEAIMVETFVPGDDYRLMISDRRFFAAVRREPASVTGDGSSTIAQLIAALNSMRSRNKVRSSYVSLVAVDVVVEQHLEHQGVRLDTVLETGRRITLRRNANVSTGGVCFDVTGEVHPHTRRMAEMVARATGLATTGLDFITTDISKPWHECGAFIEINVSPGIGGLIPALDAVSVGSAILGTTPARIPIRLVVTPRSELAHALDHLRRLTSAEGFGWASDGEAALDEMPLRITRTGPCRAVETLLKHRLLQRACLLCSVEDIVRHGMPVDKVESTALFRCSGMPLPAAWLKVLGDHSGTISTCSDWTDLRLAEFATSRSSTG